MLAAWERETSMQYLSAISQYLLYMNILRFFPHEKQDFKDFFIIEKMVFSFNLCISTLRIQIRRPFLSAGTETPDNQGKT